jgi:hypothetical protein
MTYHDVAMKRFSQWWLRAVRCGFGYADVARLSRASSSELYRKEMIRALLWGGVLPITIILFAAVDPNAFWGMLAYPVQVARIAVRRGASSVFSWRYAALITLSKFAECQGILKLYSSKLRDGKARFEYKRLSE